MTKPEARWAAFQEALSYGRYFDAHDILEGEWLETKSVRTQGAIWVAAAFHHWSRGNQVGVTRLLHKLNERAGPDARLASASARWLGEAQSGAGCPGLTTGEIQALVAWARGGASGGSS